MNTVEPVCSDHAIVLMDQLRNTPPQYLCTNVGDKRVGVLPVTSQTSMQKIVEIR